MILQHLWCDVAQSSESLILVRPPPLQGPHRRLLHQGAEGRAHLRGGRAAARLLRGGELPVDVARTPGGGLHPPGESPPDR